MRYRANKAIAPDKIWPALYNKPFKESQVRDLLSSRGIEVCLPESWWNTVTAGSGAHPVPGVEDGVVRPEERFQEGDVVRSAHGPLEGGTEAVGAT